MEVPASDATSPETVQGGSTVPPEDIAAEPIDRGSAGSATATSSTARTSAAKEDAASASVSTGGSAVSSATTGGSSRTSSGPSSANTSSSTRPTTDTRSSTSGFSSAVQPGSRGNYLLYLGSFGSYANAQKKANELKGKGVPADVTQASKPDGTLIYRVRVAYFEGYSKAKAYGDELKHRLGVDFWVAER